NFVTTILGFDYLFELFARNVFVFDLADDLFEDVFDSYETTNTAILVDDHRELHVRLLHLFKQVGDRLRFRYEIDRTHKRFDAFVFAALGPVLKQIAHVDHALDVVDLFAIDGKSRVFRVENNIARLTNCRILRNGDDVRPRRHDFTHARVAKLDDR